MANSEEEAKINENDENVNDDADVKEAAGSVEVKVTTQEDIKDEDCVKESVESSTMKIEDNLEDCVVDEQAKVKEGTDSKLSINLNLLQKPVKKDQEDTENKNSHLEKFSNDSNGTIELEEEDVPANFFDDLMNEDFIDGLNVVDAWDESDPPKKNDLRLKDQRSPIRFPSKSPHDEVNNTPLVLHTKHFQEKELRRLSREEYPTSREKSRDHKSSPSRRTSSSTDHKSDKSTRIKKPKNSSEEVDTRRDPSKTKRDIQRDKDKCAKDEEAKIISEKLKVCETGLVPPGTEMDIDLEKIPQKEIKVAKPSKVRKVRKPKPPTEVTENPADFTAKYAHRRSRSLELILKRRRLERMRDLERLSMERRSMERRQKVRRSLERRSLDRRRNARARSRSRSRTPPRRRSPLYRRSRSVERRSIEHRKVSEEGKPGEMRTRPRRRSRTEMSTSPQSDLSEREAWLRYKERGRSRSGSPASKKNRLFLKQLDRLAKPPKKKSFLKELEEKLFPMEPHHMSQQQSTVLSMSQPPPPIRFSVRPVLAPAPVPPPHPNFPNPMVRQEYDQSFFIGNQPEMVQPQFPVHGCPPDMGPGPYPHHVSKPEYPPPGFPPHMGPHGFHHQNMPHKQMGQPMRQPMVQPLLRPMAPMQLNPQHGPVPMNSAPTNPNLFMNNVHNVQEQSQQGVEGYKKLLEEKKITLSDYLSFTAKFSDNSKPVDIQNKIKVISRCQEAIKELSEDSKVGGSFIVRKRYKSVEKVPESNKYQSPLKKLPPVRFQYTTLNKQNEVKINLPSSLNRLLLKIGQEPVFDSPKPSPVPQEIPTTPVVEKIVSPIVQHVVKPVPVAKFAKFCQTETFKCKDCEARKSIRSCSVGSQSVGVLTFDVSCQVTEENFTKSLKSILKNQSLAHLTPAQLLAAQAADDESPSRELFPAARKMPHMSEQSPEPKKMRMSISNNDSFPSGILPTRADRVTTFELSGNRFIGTQNSNEFDGGRYDPRYVQPDMDRDRFNAPISNNRPNFERTPPFMTFPNRGVPYDHPNYIQKPRNTGPNIDNSRPFFDPSHGNSSGGFQGGQRY